MIISTTNKKVLVIDADPQGNATSGLGVDKDNVKYTVYDLLVNDIDARFIWLFSHEKEKPIV